MPDPDLLNPATSDWSVEDRNLADVLADHDPTDLVLAVPVGDDGIPASGGQALAVVGLDAESVRATTLPRPSVCVYETPMSARSVPLK